MALTKKEMEQIKALIGTVLNTEVKATAKKSAPEADDGVSGKDGKLSWNERTSKRGQRPQLAFHNGILEDFALGAKALQMLQAIAKSEKAMKAIEKFVKAHAE